MKEWNEWTLVAVLVLAFVCQHKIASKLRALWSAFSIMAKRATVETSQPIMDSGANLHIREREG